MYDSEWLFFEKNDLKQIVTRGSRSTLCFSPFNTKQFSLEVKQAHQVRQQHGTHTHVEQKTKRKMTPI